MAIKNLAVAYNASSNADAAVEFAVLMAKKYGATLTGVHAYLPMSFGGEVRRWIPEEVIATLHKAEEDTAKGVEAKFREKAAEAGFKGSLDWITEEGQPNSVLARCARYFDIMLLGQFSETPVTKKEVRAEDLVTLSGAPLIIVPNGYQVHDFTEKAVIAWDGSRPAARALTYAMQILETKKKLDVVTVGAKERSSDGKDEHKPNILTHLERHGIEAQRVELKANRDGVGATILEYCAKTKPDVLVTGAYGHARLREDLFGGVTRHILHNMNVPVLMAH